MKITRAVSIQELLNAWLDNKTITRTDKRYCSTDGTKFPEICEKDVDERRWFIEDQETFEEM